VTCVNDRRAGGIRTSDPLTPSAARASPLPAETSSTQVNAVQLSAVQCGPALLPHNESSQLTPRSLNANANANEITVDRERGKITMTMRCAANRPGSALYR